MRTNNVTGNDLTGWTKDGGEDIELATNKERQNPCGYLRKRGLPVSPATCA